MSDFLAQMQTGMMGRGSNLTDVGLHGMDTGAHQVGMSTGGGSMGRMSATGGTSDRHSGGGAIGDIKGSQRARSGYQVQVAGRRGNPAPMRQQFYGDTSRGLSSGAGQGQGGRGQGGPIPAGGMAQKY
jgi:hypothetical protein